MQSIILDTSTIVIMVVAISVILSISMIFIMQTRRTYPGFDLWAAGNAGFTAAFLLIILRGIIPDIFSVVAANAIMMLAALLFSEGIRIFRGRGFRKGLCAALFITIVALQSYFTFVNNDIEVRIIIVSILLGTVFGLGAVELFRNVDQGLRPTFYLTGSFFAFLSLFMILRALITYLNPGLHDFFSPSRLQAATFIIIGLFGIASTFGFITLNSGRLESDLKKAQNEMSRLLESAEESRRELISVMDERELAGKLIRIRLNLFEYSISHSLDELLQKALDEVCDLTGSAIGFYHFVEKDQKTLSLHAWSTRTTKEFCKAEGDGMHYGIDKAGVWVDCVHERKPVIHNDYNSLPHRKGLPEGHAAVIRELVVPIIRSDKIVAILGIGNKPENYTEKDVEIVSYLADIAWEIAEHKQAEKEVRRNRNLLQKIFDILPVGLWIADKKGKLLYGNPAGLKIWGAESGVGQRECGLFNARRLPSGEDVAPDDWALSHTINKGVTIKDEMLEIDAFNGNKKIILNYTAPVLDDAGNIDGAIIVNRDITERMRAEKDLLEREVFINAVIENLPIGVAVNSVDPAVQFNYVNDNFLNCYRITREALGEPDAFWNAVYEEPEFREEMKRRILNDCASGDPNRMYWVDVPITRKGEETVYITARNIPIPDKKLMISIVWDTTESRKTEVRMQTAHEERRRMLESAEKARLVLLSVVEDQKLAEEEITKLNAELEQRVKDRTAQLEAANKELEAFSYSVSHDLRGPLQHITGFAELLNKRASGYLDEKNKHYLKVITDSTIRMGRLIDDLLTFSRMGRTEMMKRRTNLDILVKEILKEYHEDTRGRDVDWKVGPLPEVYGDSAMIRQVLVNLVSNAFKYTRKCDKAIIEIGSVCGDNGEVCVFVRDNGAGFDMKYVDKLFGLFQRLHRAEDYDGTGVGLANVRRIVHRHGGKVWAEGKTGEGATFWFTLSA